MQKTIFALSTLAGKSGVAIIRISGNDALRAIAALCPNTEFKARIATFAELIDTSNAEPIDQAIIIYFKSPNSFTGEDVIEIQFHGSIAVIDHLLEVLGTMPFLRMAEPGEFSKRAFLNSKLDLTQAEGLADLIDSETRLQKSVALRQLGGQLGTLYNNWRTEIISHLSKLEALIDFPEDDIPASLIKSTHSDLVTLSNSIKNHLSDNHKGEIIQRGLNVAIVGAPNVGKSSLLNTIAKSEIAIVSDIAGTTRDVIRVKIDLSGYPITLYDTAGIRETADQIEAEGVKRAVQTISSADIQIVVLDGTDSSSSNDVLNHMAFDKPTFILVNKVDLIESTNSQQLHLLKSKFSNFCQSLEISVKTGYSIDAFLKALTNLIKESYSISNEPLITHHRYRVNLTKCVTCLDNFDLNDSLDISTEYIRQAAVELGRITGKIEVEEILDVIFSSFCIGK
jgi:tRNA modification GTPase